jgi:hypothetical protein
MKCPGCGFENMPGFDKCFRCGAILSAEPRKIEINPPRMPRWKRPARALRRCLRKAIPRRLHVSMDLPQWFDPAVGDTGWILLSIIPGLGHLIFNRLRSVAFYLAAWAVIIVLSLVFFGSSRGVFFAVTAAGIHAMIATGLTAIHRDDSFLRRLALNMLMTVVFACMYLLIIRGLVGLRSLRVVRDYPYYNIVQNDVLIFHRGSAQRDRLKRGSIVACRVDTFRRIGNRAVRPAQIIGLPGETVSVSGNVFVVNGAALDMVRFPLPDYLRGVNVSEMKLSENQYFVSVPYQVVHGGQQAVLNLIHRMCFLDGDEIIAKARFVWMPFDKFDIIEDIDIQGIQ